MPSTPITPSNERPMREFDDEPRTPSKTICIYLPLFFSVALILAPHPSLLFVLVNYHIRTLHAPIMFTTHLFATYGLTFLIFSSLMVCVVRDPGPAIPKTVNDDASDDEVDLTEALMSEDWDHSAPGRWCRKCWAPKPERTHHCSTCGRCVLKMDHHCPWIGSKCVGHRTYPAFLHFLGSITLLALYIAVLSLSSLTFAFQHPLSIDEVTPVHELFLAAYGLIFAFVIGSFLCYHIYLVATNQTTLEHTHQFMLLRHLPPLPPSPNGYSYSVPPLEHELSYAQRNLVRDAHGSIHLYDVGLRNNFSQVFGWNREWGWVHRLFYGGGGKGDGKSFPRNPHADEMLARLAEELLNVDKNI